MGIGGCGVGHTGVESAGGLEADRRAANLDPREIIDDGGRSAVRGEGSPLGGVLLGQVSSPDHRDGGAECEKEDAGES